MSLHVRLQRIDAAAGVFRSYEIRVVSDLGDLFGSAAVHRRFGRIGEAAQERWSYFDRLSDAETFFYRKLGEKKARGYEDADDAIPLEDKSCYFCGLLNDPQVDPCYVRSLSSTTLVVGWDQTYRGRSILVLNKHIPDFFRVSHQEMLRLLSDIKTAERMIQAAFSPAMMNYLFMGNVARHAHLHLVPRYEDDPHFGESPFLDTSRVRRPSLTDDEYRELARRVRQSMGVA